MAFATLFIHHPALRREELVAGLWERLNRGEIDYLGSDHSPFLVEEKEPFWDDMWRASPGAPGLESLLPAMLTAVGVVREKEVGTLEQLNVTPLARWELIVGKLLPYALIGMVDVARVDDRAFGGAERGQE